jgi:TonB family protein
MPAYPPAFREAGIVGGSILELRVDAQGKLIHLSALRSSHPEFEAAAKDAVSKWEFKAAQKNGQPVESRARIAIVFETVTTMADIKWRIAPRPSFGSFVVIRPDTPIVDEEEPAGGAEQPAPATPAPAAPTK